MPGPSSKSLHGTAHLVREDTDRLPLRRLSIYTGLAILGAVQLFTCTSRSARRSDMLFIAPILALLTIALGFVIDWRNRPWTRGRLSLQADGLRFSHGENSLLFRYEDLSGLGRRGRWLRLRCHTRGPHLFRCPRLLGEDLFDEVCKALEARGLQPTIYESRRIRTG